MSRSLPEMGDWDGVFDETYLQTYLPLVRPRSGREPRRSAPSTLAESRARRGDPRLPVAASVAMRFALAEAGYRVTGFDRSASQLAEAERRRGPCASGRDSFVATIGELPFADASFDAVLQRCSRRSATSSATRTSSVLRELRRVLRPGRALIVETAHRDAFARSLCSPSRGAPGTGSRTARSTSKSARPTGRPARSTRTG